MKIKITQPGFESYTGLFGRIEFENGISVDHPSRIDAERLAGIISIETEDGDNPSVAQRIIDSRSFELPSATVPTHAEVPPVEAPVQVHSLASLEELADKRGIKGLREIADPLGLKGNAIGELIEKILSKQAADAASKA